MPKYTVQLTKVIVSHVEASCEDEAIELAQDYDCGGWDGMWTHAEPEIQIIEVSDK